MLRHRVTLLAFDIRRETARLSESEVGSPRLASDGVTVLFEYLAGRIVFSNEDHLTSWRVIRHSPNGGDVRTSASLPRHPMRREPESRGPESPSVRSESGVTDRSTSSPSASARILSRSLTACW